MFARRNSDTWMRSVSLLIRDSVPRFVSSFRGEESARTHQRMHTIMQAHQAAGGHLSAGQIKAGKVNSSSLDKCRTEREVEKCF